MQMNCNCGYNMYSENDNCKMKTREEMLEEINAHSFSVTELALYLDNHPCDEKALCLHRENAKKLRNLTDAYQKMYGPLTIEFPCNMWRWLEEPWPWERGGNY